MNSKLLLILVVLLIIGSGAQSQVETEIQSKRIFDLSVIQVFPDSFPDVEVIFQARNQAGQPLWGISENDISVIEDSVACQVLELTNISEQDIIDIAIVFDHSGSMGFPSLPDSLLVGDLSQAQYDSLAHLPTPIEFAKEGVLTFISSAELASDSILIVGFSSEVDEIVGPTQDTDVLQSKLLEMQAGDGTAFYDGLVKTISHLALKKEQKKAIVALTDGQDNGSLGSVDEVVRLATEHQIPIYVIGLGKVHDSTLRFIAAETKGLFYKTDNPEKLEQIYLNISRQLKSVYKLKYTSTLQGFVSNEENLTIGFTNDTLTFSNPDVRLTLPEQVIGYLHEQEESRLSEIRNQNILIGTTAAGVAVLGLGSFLLYRRKRKRNFSIINLFPNPFSDELSIEIETASTLDFVLVEIIDLSGNIILSERKSTPGTLFQIATTRLPSGNYVLRVSNSKGDFDTIQGLKQ